MNVPGTVDIQLVFTPGGSHQLFIISVFGSGILLISLGLHHNIHKAF